MALVRPSNVGCPSLLQAGPQPLKEQQQGQPAWLVRASTPSSHGKPQQRCSEEPDFKAQSKPSFLAIQAKLPVRAGTPLYCLEEDFYHFSRQRMEN